ncbi:MAG: hypothetical protein PHF00_05080, partial [Elusimicrobia bacterium]|nr:hypothetical protein [Elusimicrobiota bacterium]
MAPSAERYSSPRQDACRIPTPEVADIAALILGIKPVAYLGIPRAAAAQMRGFADAAGLRTLTMPSAFGPRRWSELMLLSRSPRLLRRAAFFLLKTRLTKPADFMEWSTRILGYPACCVKFRMKYAPPADPIPQIHAHSGRPGAVSFLMNTIFNLTSRISPPRPNREPAHDSPLADAPAEFVYVLPWQPCSYHCRKSLSAAQRIWSFLKLFSPSYAEHLERRLARPVLYFSPLKFVVFAGRCPTPAACSYTAILSRPWQMDAAAVAQLQQSDLLLLGQDSITTLK